MALCGCRRGCRLTSDEMKTIHRVTEGMAEAYARLELRFEALLRVSSTVVSLEPPRWCCCVFHHLFSADHLALQSCFHLFGLKRLLFTGWHHPRFGVHGKGKDHGDAAVVCWWLSRQVCVSVVQKPNKNVLQHPRFSPPPSPSSIYHPSSPSTLRSPPGG